MMRVRVVAEDGTIVCADCVEADSFWLRLRGLMFRRELPRDEGMLFRGTGSIHMFFMRFAIDAVFCDAELRVVRVVRGLRPWRLAAARGAKVVIELADGAAAGVDAGDRLVLRNS
ncbi:MAG TPA: DUF192 domain-containing protein [Gaiellaceae bacterium]